ncbi:MAG: hypothetical protein KDD61_04710 [Bdellovibrionales bacterium]|nr:hypothetical protein [Bdellovibrionales bacterium]
MRKPLKRLFALNPKAQTLRTKRKKAEAAFKVALVSGEPALISTAKAYLIYVKGQQLSLRAKQQSEVMEIQSIANERERQLRKDFQMQYQTHLKSFNNGSFSPQLIFYPPLSLSPSYRLAPFTLEPTTLQARWSIKANHSHFLEHIPFLKNLNSPLSLKGQCATELKLRKDKWHIRIKEGRS